MKTPGSNYGAQDIATTGQVVYPHCMYTGHFILSKPTGLKQKFLVVEFYR